MINLDVHIERVARHLLGEPNKSLSNKLELRFGSNGSLSVEIAGPKRGTWYDHEHKRGGGVLDLLELECEVKGFPAAAEWFKRELGIEIGDDRRNAADHTIYDYVDAAGKLLFQVHRGWKDGKKIFWQSQPGPDRGGIKRNPETGKPSMKGVRYVPYHLDEIERAHALAGTQPWRVFIPEGEKDVDRLRNDWGVVATCNPGGAEKWRKEYARYFAGADVVILADNDETGRRHVEQVATSLHGTARSIKIVEFPELPEKKDISDWIDRGGTQGDLEDRIDGVALWQPPPEPPEPFPPDVKPGDVELTDFFYFMAQHKAIYAPNREIWPLDSLNDRFPKIGLLRPSKWLAQNRPVEQTIWAPGEPTLIRGRLVNEGGWITRHGATCFNLYLPPPQRPLGDPNKAGLWRDHLARIYPHDCSHIERFLAHRIQCPAQKINHALMLGGDQGIGKDTILEPVKRAIGSWNFREATPQQVLGRFNGFVQGVILRISEARDLGERTRRDFYDHMKVYIAAPPDVLRVDEKNIREHAVLNVCAVIETTNYEGGEGPYLPADDRRHYVAQSACKRSDFDQSYWSSIWNWYDDGGDLHVAAYLAGLDLSGFNPKAPPPQTEAFWAIVNAYRAPEDAELADVIEAMGSPDVVTLRQIVANTSDEDFENWLKERSNRRLIPHRFRACGYVPVRYPDADDGLWKIRGHRQVVYGTISLSPEARLAAVYAAIRGNRL